MSAGWGYPFEMTDGNGMVRLSEEKENIRESVMIILSTEPGERLLHPNFGTKLHQFLFEPMDARTEEMICREVRHSLQLWEKRIYDIEVEPDTMAGERGMLRIAVSYRIGGSGKQEQVEIAVGG